MDGPPEPENGPPEPRGGTLAKLIVVQGDLESLKSRVEDLSGQVGAVAEAFDALDARERATKPAPIWWDLLTEAELAEARPALLAWLRDVVAATYPEDIRGLAPCWEHHPDVRQYLTAAWRLWQAAYLNRSGDSRDDADFQARWRPDLFQLAVEAATSCRDRGRHEPPEPLDDDLLASFEPVHDA